MSRTTLHEEELRELGRGPGTPRLVERLGAARMGKTLVGLRALLSRAPDELDGEAVAGLRAAYDLLARVQRADPDLVRSLLDRPQTDAWAARWLGPASGRARAASQAAYLSNLSASAAIRSGMTAAIDVEARSGVILLPELGRLVVGPSSFTGRATVEVGEEETRVSAGECVLRMSTRAFSSHSAFHPVRRVRVGTAYVLDVEFDEEFGGWIDSPYGDARLLGRLGEVEWEQWRRRLAASWELLEGHHPEYAATLAAGLRCLVPLTSPAQGTVSATSSTAFGAVAISLPAEPSVLAVTLVHEFQHGKLSVVLDSTRLHEPAGDPRFYAPWRDDPRPLVPFLQGVYAHLGVAQFWDVHRHVAEPPWDVLAHVEFTRWRDQTWQAVEQLDDRASLTEEGSAFVAEIRGRLRDMLQATIPGRERELAEWAAADHRIVWRLRNLQCDPEAIETLVREWTAGLPEPTRTTVATSRRIPSSPKPQPRRLLLFYERLSTVDSRPDSADPDELYVMGDYVAAAAGYRDIVAGDPSHTDAWAGLLLITARTGPRPICEVILSAPELIMALCRRVGEADPADLARWLGTPPFRAL
ncbi:HEXXH motif domain-containing protein [Nonomuraea sp. NPDC048826]|uniref:HEXXH motif domain-containing protein n=1 Tax=Nonomuraea sp. NPDC048826 TaxID=3364347 RepID=UPI003715A954